ncbi:hypothetical protein PIB30_055425 [Stylosanthes scabra]|uniref:Uncharacterized protein n=1 Tax=Stylosanthes scabra TaxID=79078 RepID=A0ABU6QJ02_9FABA|nr:hypothetical protein [Stylosanthes scabra]
MEALLRNLVYVIAKVVGNEKPRDITTVTEQPTKRMALKIQDLEKNTIEAVLFGALVDQIQPHLEKRRVEPLIVVFQLFRANRYEKLIIDPTLLDVTEFRTRLLGDQPNASVRITQGSAAINDLRRGTEKVMNIEQVMDREEVSFLLKCFIKCLLMVSEAASSTSPIKILSSSAV